MEERKVKYDFSSKFQPKGWGLFGGVREIFTNAFGLWFSVVRQGIKLDDFRALDSRGETNR